MAYRQKGMYQQAISEFKKAIELSEGRPDFVATLGHAYAVSGDKSQALKIARQLDASHAPPFVMAIVYLGLGDKDRTFTLLDQAYEQRFPSVLPEALQDPIFDPIRADSRFQELLRRLGRHHNRAPHDRVPARLTESGPTTLGWASAFPFE